MVQTRAQRDLKLAYELVSAIDTSANNDTKSIYQQLCKQFPVMVMQSGLCQTLAFHADKASKIGDRGEAHKLILTHAAKVIAVDAALHAAQTCDALEYMHHTRRILGAWIYFKRFAVSALEIEKEVNHEPRTT